MENKTLYKAYPTTLENLSIEELTKRACSFDTPFTEHLLIAEEIKRRKVR